MFLVTVLIGCSSWTEVSNIPFLSPTFNFSSHDPSPTLSSESTRITNASTHNAYTNQNGWDCVHGVGEGTVRSLNGHTFRCRVWSCAICEASCAYEKLLSVYFERRYIGSDRSGNDLWIYNISYLYAHLAIRIFACMYFFVPYCRTFPVWIIHYNLLVRS